MIVIIDDTRELIHVAGLNYSQAASLCNVCKKYAFCTNLTVQEFARELPAHLFYKYETVLIISLSWREVFVLSAIITDEMEEGILHNRGLEEIFEALNCAFEMAMK